MVRTRGAHIVVDAKPASGAISRAFPSIAFLKKLIRSDTWSVAFDRNFEAVIDACAEQTPERLETWISDEMKMAYLELHRLGFAHSVEIYVEDELAGGLYGVHLGRVFFGESMFSRWSNASKIALHALCDLGAAGGLDMIDCQLPNDHLQSLGMELIQRADFESILKKSITVVEINDDGAIGSEIVTPLSLDKKLLDTSLALGK